MHTHDLNPDRVRSAASQVSKSAETAPSAHPLASFDLLRLQRTVGNQAVGRMLTGAEHCPSMLHKANKMGLSDPRKADIGAGSIFAQHDDRAYPNSAVVQTLTPVQDDQIDHGAGLGRAAVMGDGVGENSIQRSTGTEKMLGIGNGNYNEPSKKQERGRHGKNEHADKNRADSQDKEKERESKRERSTIRETRHKPRYPTERPTLEVECNPEGVKTQFLNQEQAIGFKQVATLTRPAGCTTEAQHCYNFNQRVKDEYKYSGFESEYRFWQQDATYRPPYTNGYTSTSNTFIKFEDHPGFSTDRKIDKGMWLEFYKVEFQWVVTPTADCRKFTQQDWEWTSPTVTYTAVSSPSIKAGQQVTYTLSDSHTTWRCDSLEVGFEDIFVAVDETP